MDREDYALTVEIPCDACGAEADKDCSPLCFGLAALKATELFADENTMQKTQPKAKAQKAEKTQTGPSAAVLSRRVDVLTAMLVAAGVNETIIAEAIVEA